jgi:type IV pilus assembly protein PilB
MKYLDKMRRKKLGELLIDEGLVTSDQVVEALKEQKKTGEPIGEILVSYGSVSEWDIARTLANQFQLPFIHTAKYTIATDVIELIPAEVLQRYQCVPLDRFDDVLTVAVAGPLTANMIEELEKQAQCELFLYAALLSDVRYSLKQQFAVERPGTSGGEELDEPVDITPAAELSSKMTNGEWERLFDMANESILSEIKPEPDPDDLD